MVSSCPLTTTPPARPVAELIVLFENVSDNVPLAFSVLAPICVDALTMFVNVVPVIDAVRLAAPLGSRRMALLAVRADGGRIAERAAGDVECRR